jgi:acyl-CoA synthetase (AMP-forming)/AMP-acid ligase II
VERFAGALYELGVRPGQVVAMQLPNWWQACALYLAAARLRAVIAPVMTTIRRRDLERLLARVWASVFVTVLALANRRTGIPFALAQRWISPYASPNLPERRLRASESHSRVARGGTGTPSPPTAASSRRPARRRGPPRNRRGSRPAAHSPVSATRRLQPNGRESPPRRSSQRHHGSPVGAAARPRVRYEAALYL